MAVIVNPHKSEVLSLPNSRRARRTVQLDWHIAGSRKIRLTAISDGKGYVFTAEP